MTNYIDLSPEVVSGAGRRTGATSQDWAALAHQSATGLREAVGGARDPVVRGLFEEFLTSWNPTMQRLAATAEAQGTNAVSAASTMVSADQQSADVLNQAKADASRVGSLLSRPINE